MAATEASAAPQTVPPAPPAVVCLICEGTENVTVSCNEARYCQGCLNSYVLSKVEELDVDIHCPVHVGCMARTITPALDQLRPDVRKKLERARVLLRTGQSLACPSCDEIATGSRWSNNVTCKKCSLRFCKYHGSAHPGVTCTPPKVTRAQQRQLREWLAQNKANTRRCPSCRNMIEKNGGCNHMTCRCGFEICWCCGDPYRRARHIQPHMRTVPGRMRTAFAVDRSASPAVWVQRAVAGVVLAPVAIVLAPLWVPKAVDAVKVRMERARQRRLTQQQFVKGTPTICRAYYDALGTPHACRTCTTADHRCKHAFPPHGSADPHVCTRCGHFVLHARACAHFFNGTHCMFCRRPATVVQAELAAADAAAAATAMAAAEPMAVMEDIPAAAMVQLVPIAPPVTVPVVAPIAAVANDGETESDSDDHADDADDEPATVTYAIPVPPPLPKASSVIMALATEPVAEPTETDEENVDAASDAMQDIPRADVMEVTLVAV